MIYLSTVEHYYSLNISYYSNMNYINTNKENEHPNLSKSAIRVK